MSDAVLLFEEGKSILLCKSLDGGDSRRWVKKLPDVVFVGSVREDDKRFYVACDYSATDGIFLALDKESGRTAWYIPGRSLLQVIYKEFLYLVFVDADGLYFLIKAEPEGGRKVWHHRVDEDLYEYSFHHDRVTLLFRSGKKDVLSARDGRMI
jgi:hypothetical protein